MDSIGFGGAGAVVTRDQHERRLRVVLAKLARGGVAGETGADDDHGLHFTSGSVCGYGDHREPRMNANVRESFSGPLRSMERCWPALLPDGYS
ncbi:MAG: hypothetical protein U5K43_09740 [Halofilum sp. (in: g-proteobacteria)]|nr:hypothetical protein [Halofilum sp. (in: g-proteobacteria)]